MLTQQPFQVWAVTDLDEPRPVALAALPAALAQAPGPSCMAVLEPQLTASGALEVCAWYERGRGRQVWRGLRWQGLKCWSWGMAEGLPSKERVGKLGVQWM